MSRQSAEYEHPVTPLELFFDLVFVFGFTQVTTLLSDDPTWVGSAVACSFWPRSGGSGRAMPG